MMEVDQGGISFGSKVLRPDDGRGAEKQDKIEKSQREKKDALTDF